MKILRFMTVSSIVTLLIVAGAVSAIAQVKYTMKIATVWATDDSSGNKGLNYLKTRIEQLTKGSVKVELYKGSLGGERDLYEGVQLGTIQAGAMNTGTMGTFIPTVEVFMIGSLFKDWNHVLATVDGYFGEYIKELALKKGLRLMAWWRSGGRQIIGRGKPVVRPEDLKGKKVRVMETPFEVELYRHYGALPTPMAYPEVYTALQQGVIDATTGGLSNVNVHHHEVSQWITVLDQQHTLIPLQVSERWWSKLPDDIKSSISQAVVEATIVERRVDEQAEMVWLKKIWTSAGCKVVEGDREAFRAKAKELYPSFEKKLGSEGKWIKWIDEVGEAFPMKQYAPVKDYGLEYSFSGG